MQLISLVHSYDQVAPLFESLPSSTSNFIPNFKLLLIVFKTLCNSASPFLSCVVKFHIAHTHIHVLSALLVPPALPSSLSAASHTITSMLLPEGPYNASSDLLELIHKVPILTMFKLLLKTVNLVDLCINYT